MEACSSQQRSRGHRWYDHWNSLVLKRPDWVRSGQWERVTQELRSGIYKPDPVRRVEIEKPDGGIRQLAACRWESTIKNRVIQQAIAPFHFKRRGSRLFLIRPFPIIVLDSDRIGMGSKQHSLAKRRVQSIIKKGRRFAVDVDLSKFFGRKLLLHFLHFLHSNHPWLLPSKSWFINDAPKLQAEG